MWLPAGSLAVAALPQFDMGDFSAPMNVGGSMSGGGSTGFGPDLGTLDEPVTETIMRDLRMVGNKMMCVLNPRKANIETLKNWDLWGPLILCLMLATLLSWFAPYEQKSLVFASVFVIIWCGAAVVTVNALLLGGNISFFQSVCVLGYCIFPLNIASLVCLIGGHILWRTVRARARASPPARAHLPRPRARPPAEPPPPPQIVVAVCFFWSTGASLGFMGELVPPNRKALAVYPLFLFYTSIGWLILIAAKR